MTHRAVRTLGLCLFLLLARTGLAQAAWSHQKTDGQTLHFVDPETRQTRKLRVSAKNPQFHGLLAHVSGPTYAVYSGQACELCGDQTAVFMTRIDGSGAPFQFVYPGQIRDPQKGVVYESRAFFGRCLPNTPPAYVSHQAEVVDRRRGLQRSVLIAEPGVLKVEDRLMETRVPPLRQTLELVRKKECTEISGRSRQVLRKNMGPGSPSMEVEDDSDEDDEFETKRTETPETPEADPSPATASEPVKESSSAAVPEPSVPAPVQSPPMPTPSLSR